MRGGLPTSALVLCGFCIFMLSMTLGVSTGLHAENVSDARIDVQHEVDNVEFNNTSTQRNNPVIPDEWEDEFTDDGPPPQWTKDLVRNTLRAALSFASSVSVWTFRNKGWIDPGWASGVVQSVTWLGIGGIFYYQYRRLRLMWGDVR